METTEAVKAAQTAKCVHYWSLPQFPTDGVFHSKCVKCGEEKDFTTVSRVDPWPQKKREVSIAAFWKSYEAVYQKS